MNAQLQIGRCVLVRQKNKRREYIRHGTQTLIASFDVVSGEIIQATVGETPTEADYLAQREFDEKIRNKERLRCKLRISKIIEYLS